MDGIFEFALLGVFGAMVGSFLNVVIHRLPLMILAEMDFDDEGPDPASAGHDPRADTPALPRPFNLAVPRSLCPACGRRVRASENIPLISFVWLNGRCAGCGWRIPARYPIVELLGALGALAAVDLFGISVQGFAVMLFAWFAIAIAFIDFEHMLIPDLLSLPLLWSGLLLNASAVFVAPSSAIVGAAVGYAALWTIDALASRLYQRTAIGRGDFKLFAAIGAWLGWQALAPALLIASTLGAAVGAAMLWSGRREPGRPIGFAPFLVIGGMAVMLSDGRIVGWFAGLVGI